jgi:hypothetical protein
LKFYDGFLKTVFFLNLSFSFIYSGNLCFDDFEEACTILKLASSLELAGANDAAREYISNYMFPNRLWHAFQCAKEANDKELFGTVMKVSFLARHIFEH